MDRRISARHPRVLQVLFWKRGETKPLTGYTANISSTGIFIASNNVLPTGSRIRLEVKDLQNGFVAEGVVARSMRAAPELSKVKKSGMGVRFMTVEELVGELMPVGGPSRRAAEPEEDSYRVCFPSRDALQQAFERDMGTGGLFVPSQRPAPLHAVVTVVLEVEGSPAHPLGLEARVVQRFEPRMPDGAKNLIAGMGVEFTDQIEASRRLRDWMRMI